MSTLSDDEKQQHVETVDRLMRDINEAMVTFNAWPMDQKIKGYQKICESMITGRYDTVPKPMQNLLMVRPGRHDREHYESETAYISWVPFILQRVLEAMQLESGTYIDEARQSMLDLLERLVDPFEPRDRGYEVLLGVVLLARGMAELTDNDYRQGFYSHGDLRHHGLVNFPDRKDQDGTVVPLQVKLNPFNVTKAGGMGLEQAVLSWDDLERGMDLGDDNGPVFAIFLPRLFPVFGAYDIVTLYSDQGTILDCRGYCLTTKSTESTAKPPVPEHVQHSFWLSATPPDEPHVDPNGWTIVSKAGIGKLYGESGTQWTPEFMKQLFDTLPPGDD